MPRSIKAVVRKGETHFIAECLELPVVTQGRDLQETLLNLQEAVSLHLAGEDLEQLGFGTEPSVLILYEMPLAHAA
ncbi:MAG: type II toxin-antitoxin system HicB family antitoxin [Candidatus Riflebacteria bacterium]|nr:type II toxin-antitoxin system HicB family antitoxin [Candidatus Riflebacteria bacterium]